MKKIKEDKLIHGIEKELEAYKIVRKTKGGNPEIETGNEENSRKEKEKMLVEKYFLQHGEKKVHEE